MSGKTIFETHRGFLLLNTIFGYSSSIIPHYSHSVQLFLRYINLAVSFITLFTSVIMLGGISNPENTVEKMFFSGAVLFITSISIFNSFYLIYRGKNFDLIVSLMNDLVVKFMNDPLGKSHFKENISSQYKIILFFHVAELINIVLTGFLFMYLKSGYSSKIIPLFRLSPQVEYYLSSQFELVFVIQGLLTIILQAKKLISEMLIIGLLHMVHLFFQHLKHSLDFVFAEINNENCGTDSNLPSQEYSKDKTSTNERKIQKITSNIFVGNRNYSKIYVNKFVKTSYAVEGNHKSTVVHERIKQWAILHQDVLKVCTELTKFLDPILTVYLCSITGTITLTACYFTVEKAANLLSMATLVFVYFSACMMSFYSLCHMGDAVAYESLTVADPAFYSIWYNTNKKITNSLKIIFQRVKTPVLMTAFRSPNFDLSRDTFLMLTQSIVSFYLALKELQKDRK